MHRYSHLPSLALLRSFEAAARHESYTMAAEELGITQSAISRQVHELEGAIGAPLFRRAGRAIRLTDAGGAFFQNMARDLAHLQTSVNNAIAAGKGATLLSIAVLPTFAARWLVPRLPAFKTLHPQIEMNLTSHNSPFDLTVERIDLAIHFGRADWPGARLSPLCPEDLAVTASPAFLQAHNITDMQDVFQGPLLHIASRPELWARYRQKLGWAGPAALAGPRFDQFSMLIAGASAGLGAAILPSYLIENELSSGALIKLDNLPTSKEEGYFIATPLGAQNESAQHLATWMRRQVRNTHKNATG